MSYEAFSMLFCVLAGVFLGTFGFAFKVITGRVGVASRFMDRNEDGCIKVLSFWNIRFYSFIMIGLLIWQSTYEHSYVSLAIKRCWDYFAAQGLVG